MSTELRDRIEAFAQTSDEEIDREAAESAVSDLVAALNKGAVRAATRAADGRWQANSWVKEGILLGFRLGQMEDYSSRTFPFFDKHTYPLKPLSKADGVRLVPGGSSIRTGSYVAPGVVCMPPMYVNVGAYVDEGTMVDSHALVGSCAQIGKHVHLSAATQIGGVLEPVNATPVIVEDEVFVGGGCGLYEGCIVRARAVLAPNVTLTSSTRIYDLVNETIHAGSNDAPLEVPGGAVVVPGTRGLNSDFARQHGLGLYAPIIVKYRDASTEAATALEDALR